MPSSAGVGVGLGVGVGRRVAVGLGVGVGLGLGVGVGLGVGDALAVAVGEGVGGTGVAAASGPASRPRRGRSPRRSAIGTAAVRTSPPLETTNATETTKASTNRDRAPAVARVTVRVGWTRSSVSDPPVIRAGSAGS